MKKTVLTLISLLAFVGLYWCVLALFGKRLQRQFTFKLRKTD